MMQSTVIRKLTYDGVGNKLSNNRNGTLTYYAHNDANQVISRTSGATTVTMQYDGNGNMITETAGASIWAYTYDYENRLTVHNIPGTTSDTDFAYNALGRRISKSVNGTLTKFLYDGTITLADYDTDDVLLAAYLTPLPGNILMVTIDSSRYYYLKDDVHCSVVAIIDSDENWANNYDYNSMGGMLCADEAFSNRFRWNDTEYDTEVDAGNQFRLTNRHFDGSGYYRPTLGKYMNQASGNTGGVDLYSYLNDSSVNNATTCGVGDILETAWDWWKRKLTPDTKPPEPAPEKPEPPNTEPPDANPDTPKTENPKPKPDETKPDETKTDETKPDETKSKTEEELEHERHERDAWDYYEKKWGHCGTEDGPSIDPDDDRNGCGHVGGADSAPPGVSPEDWQSRPHNEQQDRKDAEKAREAERARRQKEAWDATEKPKVEPGNLGTHTNFPGQWKGT